MLALSGLLVLALSPLVVQTFTFPGDWHKIRQMMEARKEQESEVLTVRFNVIGNT